MIIKANTLGKLLGHEPVEVSDIEGRKVQLLGDAAEEKPETNTKTERKKEIERENSRKYYQRNRERILASQREYLARKRAKEGKPAPVPRKLANKVSTEPAIEPAQELTGLNIDRPDPVLVHNPSQKSWVGLAFDKSAQHFSGVPYKTTRHLDGPGPVSYTPPEEQRFEVSGHSAFRIAQAMFDEDLLTCSMIIEGQKLQFIFTVKGKS